MATFTVSPGNTFAYDHIAPTSATGRTFVCFNALSGDRAMWLQTIGDAVKAAGHGLLIWNFRGQGETTYDFTETSDKDIISDAIALMEEVKPVRPIHVGLSIGGLFAIRAHEAGGAARADAIVLINTLRRAGPRLDWINRAVLRTAEIGGLDLMRDLYMPLLMNEGWQADNKDNFLKAQTYTPAPADDGAMLLLKAGVGTDWDVDYAAIDVPVLSLTGVQDRVFRDPADVDALSAQIKNLTRVDLDNAGHMIPLEQPDALSKAVVDFAAKL